MAGATPVDPDVEQVWSELCSSGVGRLLQAARSRGGNVPESSRVPSLFGTAPPQRMAAAALEMAVLDAELRRDGLSVARRFSPLGPPPTAGASPIPASPGKASPVVRVPAGVVVGIPGDRRLATVRSEVGRAVDRGFARVRLKIEPGWDLEPVAAVRGDHPGLVLQADANGSYRLGRPDGGGPDDARRLAGLDALGLACVEQPLPAADLPGHAALADLLTTPVCLDESLTTPRRVEDAIRYGACEVACLKPARLGGLSAARRALDHCRAAGVGAFVGGFFETGLGRTANAALAALAGFTLPGDLSAPSDYLVEDPFDYPPVVGGFVHLGGTPGIAPAPDDDVLRRLTRRREWLAAS